MKRKVPFYVSLTVEDNGDFDSQYPKEAINQAMTLLQEEGLLVPEEDESTELISWDIQPLAGFEIKEEAEANAT